MVIWWVNSKNGDLTSKHIKHGDVTSENGDLTSKNYDLTSKHGDLTSKQ